MPRPMSAWRYSLLGRECGARFTFRNEGNRAWPLVRCVRVAVRVGGDGGALAYGSRSSRVRFTLAWFRDKRRFFFGRVARMTTPADRSLHLSQK